MRNKKDLKKQSKQNFLKTINYMQPGSRERYQHYLRSQESWLNRVSLRSIWIWGGISIVIVFILIVCGSNYEWNKTTHVNTSPSSVSHKYKHRHTTVHHGNSLQDYRPVIHVPNVKHYYLPVQLTPTQVAYFNQFYWTNRSRRNYTKLKDIYNARMIKSNKLIHHYQLLSKRYAHPKTRHEKYMLAKSNAMIKFFKHYEKYITYKMRKQYPHFNHLIKQNSGQIEGQSHVKPRHTIVYTYHSYGSNVNLPHVTTSHKSNNNTYQSNNTQPTNNYGYNNTYMQNGQSNNNQPVTTYQNSYSQQ